MRRITAFANSPGMKRDGAIWPVPMQKDSAPVMGISACSKNVSTKIVCSCTRLRFGRMCDMALTQKKRPSVDSHVHALAARFMEDYRAHHDQADPPTVVE